MVVMVVVAVVEVKFGLVSFKTQPKPAPFDVRDDHAIKVWPEISVSGGLSDPVNEKYS